MQVLMTGGELMLDALDVLDTLDLDWYITPILSAFVRFSYKDLWEYGVCRLVFGQRFGFLCFELSGDRNCDPPTVQTGKTDKIKTWRCHLRPFDGPGHQCVLINEKQLCYWISRRGICATTDLIAALYVPTKASPYQLRFSCVLFWFLMRSRRIERKKWISLTYAKSNSLSMLNNIN